MGNKKSKNKNGEMRIITDKPKNSEYTFVDESLSKQLLNPASNHSNDDLSGESKKREENDMGYSLRKHSDKLKKNSADYLRFKTSKTTKAYSKQNHSPVYE
jgi:alpha-glucosidase (family GH31 glycosyl hydrolase)